MIFVHGAVLDSGGGLSSRSFYGCRILLVALDIMEYKHILINMKTLLTLDMRHLYRALMAAVLFAGPGALFPVLAQTGAKTDVMELASTVVAVREVDETWSAEAVVEAVRQSTVAAQTTGRINELRVEAGDVVRAGAVLARIDSRESGQALVAAQAQSTQARANLARVRRLVDQKFMSPAALDKAVAEEQAAAAQVAQAGAMNSHGVITAPFSGVVAQRFAQAGEMAMPGRPLLTLFDPKGLRVVASIPQYRLAEVRQALQGRVELPGSGKWLTVERIEVLPTADALSHAVTVRLYLADAQAGLVVPGTFARAHFVTGKTNRLVLPSEAVLRRGELTGVYVLDAKGQARLRQLRLGEVVAGGGIEVLAGLQAGERVALDPIRAGFVLTRPR